MQRYGYVARVLALLIGFYLLCIVLVAGLITLTVVGFKTLGADRLTIFLLVVSAAAVFVVVRGVFVSTQVRARHVVGVEMTAADQPALWQRVGQLAARVGTRAPRRIYLVPDVNAGVWENTWLLGLVPGKRHMVVGVPLLLALSPAQLDAVLAHELGHYGNRDTRLGGLVGRVRAGVLSALRAAAQRRGRFQLPGAAMFVAVFRWYAKLVLGVTQEASRAQELAADRMAASIAGKVNTIAALRELPVIDVSFDFYLDRYVGPGLELGLIPPAPEVFGGFARLLAEPARHAELDKARQDPPAAQPDPFDSHPPTAERIAALAALPEDGIPVDASGARAIAILARPAGVLSGLAARTLQHEVAGKASASWDALAQATGLRRAEERARPLTEIVATLAGRPARLATFLELTGAGRLNNILDALPPNEAARRTNAKGRVAHEHAKTELAPMLAAWLVADVARSGRAGWSHSWADIDGELHMAPELRAELDAAIEALVALRPDDAPLRAVLRATAVAA